jgi:hypothetical protein
VIGGSTFELQPVFETLAENAVKLCSAERAFVHCFDRQLLRVVATHNVSPELRAFVERNPITPDRHSIAGRAAFERRSDPIHDVQADPEYGAQSAGFRDLNAHATRPPGNYIPNQMSDITEALSNGRLKVLLLLGTNMLS